MKKLIYFFATLMVLTFGMACQKMTEENQFDSEDILKMEMEDSDIMSEEEQVSLDCSFDYTQLLASCATVTESSSTFPKIITIDYGEGCTDIRGRVKSGRIIVEVSGDMRLEGSVRTITFDQFFVNNTNIQGSRIAENIGANGSGNMVIKVNGDIIATNGSLTRSRTFERYREWISGINTCEFSDDEFLITGSGTATGRRGVEVPHEITEAIHMMPGSCEYPLSGTLDIGGERRGVIIDFGDGECDNIASLHQKKRNRDYQIDLDTRTIIE